MANPPLIQESARVDDRCEACARSVAERFPGELPPVYCDACEDEFTRELRAGHVRLWTGQIVRAA